MSALEEVDWMAEAYMIKRERLRAAVLLAAASSTAFFLAVDPLAALVMSVMLRWMVVPSLERRRGV